MPNLDQNIEIVSNVYDTILNPEAWSILGERIRSRYHCVYSGLYVYDTITNKLVYQGTSGTDESFVKEYAERFCFIDPYRESEKLIAENPGVPLTDFMFDKGFFSVERNHKLYPYFGEYWHKYDCHHAICAAVDLPGNLRAGICAPRSSTIGPYTETEKRDFEVIRQSFHRAMHISKQVHQIGENASALEQTLDSFDQPLFITDKCCRLLLCNKAGITHLSKKTVLKEVNGKLKAISNTLAKNLENAISRSCSEAVSEKYSLSKKYVQGPIEILISPIQRRSIQHYLASPRAVVFLFEKSVTNPNVLAQLYKLSPAESDILSHIAAGKVASEISKLRGTSPHTIKTQLRNIYYKTGTKNMRELRRRINTFSN